MRVKLVLGMKLGKVEMQIGADPEFEELQDWLAYSPVPTSFYGTSNEIGADGAGSQVEIRPKPGRNHIELVRNIKRLISKINVPLSIKGDRYPLGGHIHLGFSDERVRKIVKDNINILYIVKLLDDFIGKPLLALSGEARGSYKRLGAYEMKPWGFEYRTPPAAYLLSPDITKIVFKIARNTVKYFLEKGMITYQVDESGLPTFRDYMRIAKLSALEYSKFKNFISEYGNYLGEAINANWGKIKPEYQISVRFRDDWDSDIRRFVEEWLERKFKRSRIKRKKSIEVVLFGLRKERGEVVYGFNCKGFRRLPDNAFSYSSEFVFGVPARLRFMISESMNTSTAGTAEEIAAEEIVEEILSEERKRETWVEETKKEWERVLRAIWKEIRNRIG